MSDLCVYTVRTHEPLNPFNRTGRLSPAASIAFIAAASALGWVLIATAVVSIF